jgi:enoyl-CoA hydratase
VTATPTVRAARDADIPHVLVITIDRPDHGNAIDLSTAEALCAALASAEDDDDVKVIILQGSGRDLTSGTDAAEAFEMYLRAPGGSVGKFPSQRARLIALDEAWWGPRGLYARLLRCRKVTVLAARGNCFEAGLYFALACDLVLACPTARFANPRWRTIGVDGDVSMLINAVGLKRAKELMFTDRVWDGDQACRYGLVDDVVAEADLDVAVRELAQTCAAIMRDGIVTEKYAVAASLERMQTGTGFAAAQVVGASLSNLHSQPGECNLLREARDRGLESTLGTLRALHGGET